jgi:hypothetical protein
VLLHEQLWLFTSESIGLPSCTTEQHCHGIRFVQQITSAKEAEHPHGPQVCDRYNASDVSGASLLWHAYISAACHGGRDRESITVCRIVDECFAAFKLKKGKWVPCTLRITNTAVERLDNMLTVLWRARYIDMKSPGPPRTSFLIYMHCTRLHAPLLHALHTITRSSSACIAHNYTHLICMHCTQ